MIRTIVAKSTVTRYVIEETANARVSEKAGAIADLR
jgi:hypothetical protein